jgi:hypothetical protein
MAPGELSGQPPPATGFPPPAEPTLFLPGVVSTDLGERDASFHPNGSEFYFTVWTGQFGVISVTKYSAEGWTEPSTVSFSGHYSDIEPFVSLDGSKLYFASNRPLDSESEPGDFNLWVASRTDEDWSDPEPLNINTDANEFYPSLDRSGILYWTAAYEGSEGGEDIYFATPTDTGFTAPRNVGKGVNTERDEFNALIAPDGSWLAFGSFGREDGLGGGDLYISFKQEDGVFGTAVNLGPEVNSSALDYCPALTPDGDAFLFSSRRTALADPSIEQRSYASIRRALRESGNGRSDIYWLDSGFIDELKASH